VIAAEPHELPERVDPRQIPFAPWRHVLHLGPQHGERGLVCFIASTILLESVDPQFLDEANPVAPQIATIHWTSVTVTSRARARCRRTPRLDRGSCSGASISPAAHGLSSDAVRVLGSVALGMGSIIALG